MYKIDPEAADDIKKSPYRNWARAFFKIKPMIEVVDNNLSEAFNGIILKIRQLSVLSSKGDKKEYYGQNCQKNG